ncbi:putative sterigmatocystin 8-O-methyltransferase precursor [Xylariaceae sp. FL1651]|nr:putative sterigmatocystin 8-O-methyltransferase precursor [Xylariaceae sp. FL1651]
MSLGLLFFTHKEALTLDERNENALNCPDLTSNLGDDNIHRRLHETGRKLSVVMEAPGDIIHRIKNTPLQLALARFRVETEIFSSLAGAERSTLSNSSLAEKSKVDPILMKRHLRYYQSYGMVAQPGNDEYCANNIIKTLGSSTGQWASTTLSSREWLRHPTHPNNGPCHVGHSTNMSPFAWLQKNPEHFGYFLPWMTAQCEGLLIFLDVKDFKAELAHESTRSTPLFVDVGGAMGHQCIALKQRYLTVPSRIILQELAHVIDQAKAGPLTGLDDIEAQAYDFFTPQPIRGARAYYLRNILHDWPDDKCLDILDNTKAGMTSDSRGAPGRATQLDMAMITCLAAMERSEV